MPGLMMGKIVPADIKRLSVHSELGYVACCYPERSYSLSFCFASCSSTLFLLSFQLGRRGAVDYLALSKGTFKSLIGKTVTFLRRSYINKTDSMSGVRFR